MMICRKKPLVPLLVCCLTTPSHHLNQCWLKINEIWINLGLLLMGPTVTRFSGIRIKVHQFPYKKMKLKMSSAKCDHYFLCLNELINPLSVGSHHYEGHSTEPPRDRRLHVPCLGWDPLLANHDVCTRLDSSGGTLHVLQSRRLSGEYTRVTQSF